MFLLRAIIGKKHKHCPRCNGAMMKGEYPDLTDSWCLNCGYRHYYYPPVKVNIPFYLFQPDYDEELEKIKEQIMASMAVR